jgi:dimethylglycine dehydrogenase
LAERFHERFFRAVPLPEGTTFESQTEALCGFNVAGPRSRELLQRLTNTSLANEDFPFFRSKRLTIAGVDAVALRVSFTGDLGWEIHCATGDQVALYKALLEAGRDLGCGPVGSRALMCLRLEKGYGSWSREYSPEWWPQESGLDGLIRLDKDFLNKGAYEALADNAPREILSIFEVEANAADASGGEPIFLPDGTPIGQVTSGGYGYHVGMSLALGYVAADHAAPGTEVDIAVLGQPTRARILEAPPFDPDGVRLRG